MPINDSKRPEKYPLDWHERLLISKRTGDTVSIEAVDDQKAGLARAKKLRAFLRSFEKYPLHSTSQAMKDFQAKTVVHEWAPGCWELAVKVSPRLVRLIDIQLKGE